jgi:hypothetical protein
MILMLPVDLEIMLKQRAAWQQARTSALSGDTIIASTKRSFGQLSVIREGLSF